MIERLARASTAFLAFVLILFGAIFEVQFDPSLPIIPAVSMLTGFLIAVRIVTAR